MKIFTIFLLAFLTISCGLKDSKKTKLIISFEKASQSRGKEFGLPDPTTYADLNCFGIFVDYPETDSGNSCTIDPNTPYKLVRPDVVGGLVPINGGELTLEVLAGENRRIQVVAFKTSYGGLYPADFCPSVLVDFDPYEEFMSDPFVIAEEIHTIPSGEYKITMAAKYLTGTNANTKLDDCVGPFFQSTDTSQTQNVVLTVSGSSSITADGTSSTTLTALITDSSANPVSGKPVTLNIPANGGTVTTNPVTTNASGVAVFNLSSSTVSGTYDYTVSVDGITSTAQTIFFLPGVTANIDLYLTGLSNLIANGGDSTTFTASVTDSNNNPVDGASVTLNIPANGGASSPTTAITNASGLAIFVLTSSNVIGTYNYTATVDSWTSLTQTVTFNAGPVAMVNLIVTGPTTIITGGATTSLQATVSDGFGHYLENKSVILNIPTDGGTTISPQMTDINGNAFFTLTSSAITGTYNYTATCDAVTSTSAIVTFSP